MRVDYDAKERPCDYACVTAWLWNCDYSINLMLRVDLKSKLDAGCEDIVFKI